MDRRFYQCEGHQGPFRWGPRRFVAGKQTEGSGKRIAAGPKQTKTDGPPRTLTSLGLKKQGGKTEFAARR